MSYKTIARINVTDAQRSVEYYTGIFPLHFGRWAHYSDPTLLEALLLDDDGELALVLMQSDAEPVPAHPGFPLIMVTNDVDAVVAATRERGLAVIAEPIHHEGFSIANVRDPDGYTLEVLGHEPPREQPLTDLTVPAPVPHPLPHVHQA